ncbi:hypothetical protein LCGC14_2657410, partial [marine sediment metagenome]
GLLIVAIVAAIAVGAVAEHKVVTLKTGQRLTGEVTKTKDGYEIKTPRGTVVVAASQVLRIDKAVVPADELKRRLDRIDQSNAEALFGVANWAWEKKLLAESLDLLNKVLKLKPDHENAALLKRLVEIALAAQKPRPPVGPTTRVTTTMGSRIHPSKLLKMDDVYRIRLLELRGSDRVPIEFRNKVLDEFIEANRGEDKLAERRGERDFRALRPVRQALYILDHTDRSDTRFRKNILVKKDPAVMRTFRTRVWPIVQAGCASASCHGGAKTPGKFKLFNAPMADDRVAYTNFYILQAWTKSSRAMIDRDEPAQSRLLQSGLPDEIATRAASHSKKPLQPPVFRSTRDRKFRLIEKWIKSLRQPLLRPGYRVNYALPGLGKPKPAPDTGPLK